MTHTRNPQVQDPKHVLRQSDHMRDMERIAMEVVSITQPAASIKRVIGRINTDFVAQWCQPNLAVRLEVERVDGQPPITRIYTIRSFDPETKQAQIDFVLHDDDSPAMRWLRHAKPGREVWMTGPRPHFVPLFERGKKAALFADDTAIPAVFAIMRAWPKGTEGSIWIETIDPENVKALPGLEGVELHLIDSSANADLNRRPQHLFEAAKGASLDPAEWTLWAAGERGEMANLRRHFRQLAFSKEELQVLGYWKRGTSSSELDRLRLNNYETGRAQGLSLEEIESI